MNTQLTPVTSAVSALVSLKDGKPVTTSQIVAESFNKEHRNVLRDIDNIVASPAYQERRKLNFELTFNVVAMPNNAARKDRLYTMDRQGFEILAMGFTGEEALRWKFKYSDAFAAMEAALTAPQPKPLPPKRIIKTRDDLSFTARDSQGRLQNWQVDHDPNGQWEAGVETGKTYFAELLELAQHNRKEAKRALQSALVEGAATNFRSGGWGIECGFAEAIAVALFLEPEEPVKKLPRKAKGGAA